MTTPPTITELNGKRILITGGAGFIGSRLTRALTAHGAEITLFDSLLEQVHGPDPQIDLPARLIVGDVRDHAALEAAVAAARPEIVVHLAAETGTGQSADLPTRYTEVNVVGTAALIEILKAQPAPPGRVVLAATRAVYGEGAYRDTAGRVFVPQPRDAVAMHAGRFAVYDTDGKELEPIPTDVTVPPAPGSVYGSSKLMQEYLLAQTPAPWQNVMLRLQNVYGPGQSLRNPYTGVLSIFSSQVMNGQTLNIYEDGEIYRDFVFIDDVVAAFVAACHGTALLGGTFNIGTGVPTSILDAAKLILIELGRSPEDVRISGRFRAGDIRYAVADISRTLATGAWAPEVGHKEGIARLVEWAKAEFEKTKG